MKDGRTVSSIQMTFYVFHFHGSVSQAPQALTKQQVNWGPTSHEWTIVVFPHEVLQRYGI
jgi:hypothetical protein